MWSSMIDEVVENMIVFFPLRAPLNNLEVNSTMLGHPHIVIIINLDVLSILEIII